MSTEQPAEAPVDAVPALRIITPHTTPEEVAAIVAVFSSLGGGEAAPARRRASWGHPARQVRQTLPHGVGGWRTSALPR